MRRMRSCQWCPGKNLPTENRIRLIKRRKGKRDREQSVIRWNPPKVNRAVVGETQENPELRRMMRGRQAPVRKINQGTNLVQSPHRADSVHQATHREESGLPCLESASGGRPVLLQTASVRRMNLKARNLRCPQVRGLGRVSSRENNLASDRAN